MTTKTTPDAPRRAFSLPLTRQTREQNLGAQFVVLPDIVNGALILPEFAALKKKLIPERDGRIAEEQERQTLAAVRNRTKHTERILIAVIVAARPKIRRIKDKERVLGLDEITRTDTASGELKWRVEAQELDIDTHAVTKPRGAPFEIVWLDGDAVVQLARR